MEKRSSNSGMSLIELLIVLSMIGILAAFGLPMLTDIKQNADVTKAKRNGQSTASISSDLSGLGVAHVLPESLGGAEGTTRLIRKGITVQDGPMKGTYFGLPSLAEGDVEEASVYLDIIFGRTVLMLEYDEDPQYEEPD